MEDGLDIFDVNKHVSNETCQSSVQGVTEPKNMKRPLDFEVEWEGED